jgi:hypothetical protein
LHKYGFLKYGFLEYGKATARKKTPAKFFKQSFPNLQKDHVLSTASGSPSLQNLSPQRARPDKQTAKDRQTSTDSRSDQTRLTDRRQPDRLYTRHLRTLTKREYELKELEGNYS